MGDAMLPARRPSRAPAPVVLTRPDGQNAALASALRRRGHEVLELPALRLTAQVGDVPDPAGFDMVVFVSGNAVRMFLDRRCSASGDWQAWPATTRAAVVGPASAAALRAHPAFGGTPTIVQPAADAPTFDSEALWASITALPVLPARVLIVRGGVGEQGTGRDWLAGHFRAAGARVELCRAYLREPAVWSAAQTATLENLAVRGKHTIWLCTSREGVDALVDGLTRSGWLAWWRTCTLIATHPRIAAHLSELVHPPVDGRDHAVLLISSPRDDDILAAIESTP